MHKVNAPVRNFRRVNKFIQQKEPLAELQGRYRRNSERSRYVDRDIPLPFAEMRPVMKTA